MVRMARFFIAFIFAASLSAPVSALSLHLGNGSGGLINTGSGNGGVVNINSGGGAGQVSIGTGGATGNNDVNLNLLGSSTSVSADVNGTSGNQVGASLGLGGLLDSLFGGSNTTGGTQSPGGGGGGGILTASFDTTDTTTCFVPNRQQIATLANRHDYLGNWAAGTTSVKIVKVPMCPPAALKLAATLGVNVNVQRLQDAIAASPVVMRKLAASGTSPQHVIAADVNGSTLVIYVI